MKRLKHFNHIGLEVLTAVVPYYSTIKMEATCTAETSVDFQLIARRYIPEGRRLHFNRFHENKSELCLLLADSLVCFSTMRTEEMT
jgi:hypothetical protein